MNTGKVVNDRKVDCPVLNSVVVDVSWKNFWDSEQHTIDTCKDEMLVVINELLEVT